ncbi:hypothetical protein, partial [Myxococcus vastator]|uniref:hypothetical protein n=1 Tax=Myxococcus vastator TaxID=2709664 RepID=UPI001966F201
IDPGGVPEPALMGITPADGPPSPDRCPSTSRLARPSADVRVNSNHPGKPDVGQVMSINFNGLEVARSLRHYVSRNSVL